MEKKIEKISNQDAKWNKKMGGRSHVITFVMNVNTSTVIRVISHMIKINSFGVGFTFWCGIIYLNLI